MEQLSLEGIFEFIIGETHLESPKPAIQNKIIEIDGIGEVLIKKNKRAKRITISIEPFKGIRVTIPWRVSFKAAKEFIAEKDSWLRKNLPKIKAIEEKESSKFIDQDQPYQTRWHELQFIKNDFGKLASRMAGNKIKIYYPEEKNLEDKEVQEIIKEALENALRKEAKGYLPRRLKDLALQNGFKFNKVSIRNSKTRWGSCNSQNNISLSLHLMRLPDHLIDYVLLHELTHTIVKNHSHRFWQMLESVLPNAKHIDQELNSYSTKVY